MTKRANGTGATNDFLRVTSKPWRALLLEGALFGNAGSLVIPCEFTRIQTINLAHETDRLRATGRRTSSTHGSSASTCGETLNASTVGLRFVASFLFQ